MPAQMHTPKTKTAPPPKPLAWWKKLLIAVFGTYIAAKFFGLIVPDVSAAGIFPHTDGEGHTEKPPIPTDEYPDDTWDYPAEDRYEESMRMKMICRPQRISMTIGTTGMRGMTTIILADRQRRINTTLPFMMDTSSTSMPIRLISSA